MPGTHNIVIVAVCSMIALSCVNPFAPRLDESLGSESCTGLATPDDVFCVFRNAYLFKDTTLYGTILADEFTFVYTDYDRAVDVSWGRTDEMRSTYGLFQNVQSLMLTWNDEIASSGDDTAKTIVRGFNLTVTFNPNDISRVDGYANMQFRRRSSSDRWQLVRWRDESNY